MYKPKPLTDAELNKFIADLDPDLEYKRVLAQQAVERMYKVPVPRLIHLKAAVGAIIIIGVCSYLIHWILIT